MIRVSSNSSPPRTIALKKGGEAKKREEKLKLLILVLQMFMMREIRGILSHLYMPNQLKINGETKKALVLTV